jgi:hypothetical protein
MPYIVIIVYCVLVVMFLLGVTFYQEFHDERSARRTGNAGKVLRQARH